MRNSKKTVKMMSAQLKRQQKTERMLPDFKTLAIVAVCILVDTFFIYGVTDYLFYQSALMSVISAVMIAFGIDATPVVIGTKIQKEKKTVLDIVILITCTLIFLAFIVLIFGIRWTMMDVVYSSGEVSSIASSLTENASEDIFVASDGEKVMTFLMALIPLATSVITFAVSTHKSVSQQKFDKMQRNRLLNYDRKLNLTAQKNEAKRELLRELDLFETEKYQLQCKKLEIMKELLKVQTRTAVAIKAGTPEAASALLEWEEDVK